MINTLQDLEVGNSKNSASQDVAAPYDFVKARRDGREYVTHGLRYVSRPISKFLINYTSVTPNQVTSLSLLLGVLGGIFLMQGGYRNQVTGASFALLYILFDLMDGEIARVKNLSSDFGKWFDGVVGMVMTPYLMFCLAYGLGSILAMITGAVAMVCFPLQYALIYYYKFDVVKNEEKIEISSRWDFLRRCYGSVTFYPLLFLAVLFQKSLYLLLFYAIFGNLFWFLVLIMQFKVLWKKR